jgi:hypothetical protein
VSERAPLRVMFHDEARFGRIVDLAPLLVPQALASRVPGYR